MTRISSNMLDKMGRSGHPCLFPDLRRKDFLFTIGMIMALGLSYVALIILRNVPSVPTLLRVFFNHKWMLNFVKRNFLHLLRWSYNFYSSVGWCGVSHDVHILNQYCIPGINPAWLWCTILLMYCWIQFAIILLRIFTFTFISDIGL